MTARAQNDTTAMYHQAPTLVGDSVGNAFRRAGSDVNAQQPRVVNADHREGKKLNVSITKAPKEHSPGRALLLSAVLPGAGQVYNRQAWKVPIIYAAMGGVAYYTYYNYNNMKQFKDEYLYRVNHDGATQLQGYESYPTSNIYNLYESYNQTFQLSVIITVAIYGLNLLDAYVFGHLFDFQINDDLTMTLQPALAPTPMGMPVPMAGLTLRL